MNAKRGYVPEDERNFSPEALLSDRQRLAIMRSLATDEQLAVRQSRRVQISELEGKEVWFGLTWSLELYIQTNARLWRQEQASGTVVIQHIVAKGTIDGQIMKANIRLVRLQAYTLWEKER